MKTTCTVSCTFTGAHRLKGSNIPCEALHGHFYRVDFTFAAENLVDGMVIEFEQTERILQGWINDNWDHTIILSEEDSALGQAISAITQQKIFYIKGSPTAENLAEYLIKTVCPQLFADANAKCIRIHMQETAKYSCVVEI